MPVFEGAAEVVELLQVLCRRPGIGELPRRGQGERSLRRRRGLPMVCLVRPAHLALLPALAARLTGAERVCIPHALVRLPKPAAETAQAPLPAPPDDDEAKIQAVRKILYDLALEFSAVRNSRVGRIRFRRFGLAIWLLEQNLREPGPGSDLEPDRRMLSLLRERALARRSWPDAGADVQAELRAGVSVPWWLRPLIPLLHRVPPWWFAGKATGRLPVFGATYRWFLRQPFLAPRDPGTFVGFAERLTVGVRDQEDAEQVMKLLANAFLEDLRRAYRRPPWRPRGARRTTYLVALLDGIRRDNHGYLILELINDVRNETGAFDPLLLVSGSEKVPPRALDPASGQALHQIWAARRARRAYQAWCYRFAAASRARTDTAWYLPFQVPAVLSPPQDPDQVDSQYVIEAQSLDATPPFTVDDPPVWARRLVLYPLLALLLALVAGTGYGTWQGWRQQHCGQAPSAKAKMLRTVAGGECIGISDGWYPFSSDPTLTDIMEKIKEQNARVDAEARTGRRYVTLVYLNALDPASAVDGLVAQTEALAGTAALQRRQLGREELLVKILVAHAGARLVHGTTVAEMLAEAAKDDPTIVGVVGLGQSRQPTFDTIDRLTRVGLPMVAAALTADSLASSSAMYYQVSPQNRWQADVVAAYVKTKLRAPGWSLAPKVIIIRSNDRTDTYSTNLAEDVKDSFEDSGFEVSQRYYQPDLPEAMSPLPHAEPVSAVGRYTCDHNGGLVFYAGRTQDFSAFVGGIERECRSSPPRVFAGDDISRHVADTERRFQTRWLDFHYVALAVGKEECDADSSDLYRMLTELFPEDCTDGKRDALINGHAALAYDAALTMLTAAQDVHDYKVPVTPASVWHAISDLAFHGETGFIDFGEAGGGHVPVDKAIAIMHNVGSGTPTQVHGCGRHDSHPPDPGCPPWRLAEQSE